MSSDVTWRDNAWLEQRLKLLWDNYYYDAPQGYPIRATFGRQAQYRYGSIFSHGRECRILINGLFAHPDVPEFVVDATIAHELAHYVHGYGSGLKKLHSHPHRGGVIDKEMAKRGCMFLEDGAGEWRRENWQAFYAEHAAERVKQFSDRDRRESEAWQAYLDNPTFRSHEELESEFARVAEAFGIKPAFTIAWLQGSLRRTGLSYRFRREGAVKVHGLLADARVPAEVVEYELSYWLACQKVGHQWSNIEREMKAAGVWERAQKAIRWRRQKWNSFLASNHPLRARK